MLLKLRYEGPLSNFAYNSNLRHYIKGVSWHKGRGMWKAQCNEKTLGCHATEEAAAQAYNDYIKAGVMPATHRSTSQFKGVTWVKSCGNWAVQCKGKGLGRHATEVAAAQAYNIEAERLGLPLNVIPPAGDADDGGNTAAAAAALALPPRPAAPAHAHAGAGCKRAAPTTPAPLQTKRVRLDTSAGARAAAAAAAAAHAQGALLEARIINDEEGAEVSHEEAGETYTEEDADGERRRDTHGASLDRRLEVDAAAGARGAAAAAAQGAALQARVKLTKAKAEVAEFHAKVAQMNNGLAEAQLAEHVAEQEAAEAERTAARAALFNA